MKRYFFILDNDLSYYINRNGLKKPWEELSKKYNVYILSNDSGGKKNELNISFYENKILFFYKIIISSFHNHCKVKYEGFSKLFLFTLINFYIKKIEFTSVIHEKSSLNVWIKNSSFLLIKNLKIKCLFFFTKIEVTNQTTYYFLSKLSLNVFYSPRLIKIKSPIVKKTYTTNKNRFHIICATNFDKYRNPIFILEALNEIDVFITFYDNNTLLNFLPTTKINFKKMELKKTIPNHLFIKELNNYDLAIVFSKYDIIPKFLIECGTIGLPIIKISKHNDSFWNNSMIQCDNTKDNIKSEIIRIKSDLQLRTIYGKKIREKVEKLKQIKL